MKKKINSKGIEVELITFSELLKQVPILNAETHIYHFNTLIKYTDAYIDSSADDSVYQRSLAYLVPHDMESLKSHIIAQSRHANWYKRDLSETLEDAIVESLNNFGVPDYLTLIAPRTWLLANSADLGLIKRGDKTALVTYFRSRTLLFTIDRITEESMLEACKGYSGIDLEKTRKYLRQIR